MLNPLCTSNVLSFLPTGLAKSYKRKLSVRENDNRRQGSGNTIN